MTGRRERYGPGPAIVVISSIIVLWSVAEAGRNTTVTVMAAAFSLILAATWLTGYVAWKKRQ